jgi:hypothetical protein
MSVFDKAKEAAKRQKEEAAKRQKQKESEVENNAKHYESLNKMVDEALSSFDGKSGIKRLGNALYKKGNSLAIAKMDVGWERWENPNYEYKVEESGYTIRWEVLDERGNTIMTGSSLDSFAECIAVHL